MRELTQNEKDILERHAKWLGDEEGGERADLSGADLSGANLYGANLTRANLSWADLSWANLTRADLTRADLYGADLSWANLTRADLTRADLSGANLTGADLYGAKSIISIGPIGSRGGITYAIRHANGIMIKCGCFWGTLEEWEKRCGDTHGDSPHGMAYRAAAEYIRAHAAAYWTTETGDA